REEVNAFEVDVQQFVERFLGGLINGGVAVYARVVDQEVEVFPPPIRFQRLGQSRAKNVILAKVSDVQLKQGRLTSQFFDLGDHGFALFFPLPIGEDHVGALPGEPQGDVPSQSPAAAGH